VKISRRDFLKGTATSLFLAGFNFPSFSIIIQKEKFNSYNA